MTMDEIPWLFALIVQKREIIIYRKFSQRIHTFFKIRNITFVEM